MKDDSQNLPSPPDRTSADITSDIETGPTTTKHITQKPEAEHEADKAYNTADAIAINEKSDYPEGGTQAWLVVLGAWCAMVPSMGLLNTLAILEAWVSSNELPTMAPSTIGWIFSCYGFFLYFCGVQVGELSVQRLTKAEYQMLTMDRPYI